MSLSDFLENKLYDHVYRNIPYTPPTTLYVAAYTSDPTDADTGTEVSGGAYARQAVTFVAPTDGAGDNPAQITFPVATAAWGNVTHVGLRDALTGGNLLVSNALVTPRNISAAGYQLVFPIGDIDVSFA